MYETIILIIAGIGLIIFLIKSVIYFNLFQNLTQDIKKSLSDLKTEYKRRNDLINNLKKVTLNYSGFEKQTFKDVTEKRKSKFDEILKEYLPEKTQGEKFKDSLNINAVKENYPKLKAIKEYLKLTNQIELTENRINDSRRDYNEKVIVYNKLVKVFPGNIFAFMFGFKEIDYYRYKLKGK